MSIAAKLAIVKDSIRLPRIVITRNPMKVIGEYINKVNAFPATTTTVRSSNGKQLEAMLLKASKLQQKHKPGSEVYQAWDNVNSAILIRLKGYVGGKYLQ